MMLMTSPGALCIAGNPDQQLVNALKTLAAGGTPVVLVSNHPQPPWSAAAFAGTNVHFIQRRGRQSGRVVMEQAAQLGVAPHELFVLASSAEDMRMGKNGGAILIAGGWSQDPDVKSLGIHVAHAAELVQTLQLIDGWKGKWWFTATAPTYGVRALADLSGKYVEAEQQQFAARITHAAKQGGVGLNPLLAVAVRSLMGDQVHTVRNQFWGVYPSSSSNNTDQEVLSDFSHRLRTTLGRYQMARRDTPLFIRHHPSTKRSKAPGANREDPTEQIRTIHLNPVYEGSVHGRHVYVIDDCTTYGLSFGVAAAFLRKAGAASVTGIALGKFGNRLSRFDIELKSDPFRPVNDFAFRGHHTFGNPGDVTAQQDLRSLLP
ncbi:hypothetical protein [Luteibacter sp. CQ10]|uniref:hypothetical protein n=1 Tax=Luteibacter sp. CQ10 TaxID=2805821 RepID=UPI0034A227EB